MKNNGQVFKNWSAGGDESCEKCMMIEWRRDASVEEDLGTLEKEISHHVWIVEVLRLHFLATSMSAGHLAPGLNTIPGGSILGSPLAGVAVGGAVGGSIQSLQHIVFCSAFCFWRFFTASFLAAKISPASSSICSNRCQHLTCL